MKKLSLVLMMIAAVAATTFISCKKDSTTAEEDYATEKEMSEHMALSEATYDDAGNIADEASTGELGSYKTGCATVTHDSASNPRKITIDFGTTNCMCKDGKNRRGKIFVTYTGRYRDAGTVITTTFDGYFVDDNQVKGTRTVTNNGLNGAGRPTFNVSVNGSIILSGGRGTITHTSTRTRTWAAGYNTAAIADDVYEINGSSTTIGPKGDEFTATIRKGLRIELSCGNIVSGIIDYVRKGSKNANASIDYGNGDCDRMATVTLPNGRSFSILLR
jgi:hypothetical protein